MLPQIELGVVDLTHHLNPVVSVAEPEVQLQLDMAAVVVDILVEELVPSLAARKVTVAAEDRIIAVQIKHRQLILKLHIPVHFQGMTHL